MYLVNSLESATISTPYNQGYRHLRVLSGYVSPLYLEHILHTYPELRIDVIVGMVSHDGLAIWQHRTFIDLVEQFSDRLNIFYQISRPGNHRKVYYWLQEEIFGLSSKVFVGSANFTMNGFGRQNEILVEATHDNIDDIFSDLDILDCQDPEISQQVNFYEATTTRIRTSFDSNTNNIIQHSEMEVLTTPTHNYTEYVDLSLLSNGVVPSRSGLNWGQREGRNPNQAYLSVPKSVHQNNPEFFPPLAESFLMITDDGEELICVMAQQNRKAIHTRENNSILGTYFRNRLGLEYGSFVSVDDLRRYGRDYVRIFKIDEETFYLDFSV
ncbi:restriction endonuclease PLD domain-containing protein [Sporosarcina sp. Marseille-Q4943]|uniref:restriction endonuclease PLD domain-containing protein n=1 Tax=Sporosarcina sp. Marseille-Q4943 TaxID=2942204 RepID=UPI00208DD3A8|nr:restriction endonuclease PLD domain-containing protein [Sporosarcina sp. Marseille-Q4943]